MVDRSFPRGPRRLLQASEGRYDRIPSMQIFLETERLVLRRFTEDDVDNLVELDSDPDVMRFIPPDLLVSRR
jgi:RimJ/RimL family protein N-acetyltransferase